MYSFAHSSDVQDVHNKAGRDKRPTLGLFIGNRQLGLESVQGRRTDKWTPLALQYARALPKIQYQQQVIASIIITAIIYLSN